MIMTFSKRIVFVYASIIIIPLLMMVVGTSFYSLHRQILKLKESASAEINLDTENIYRILTEFDSIETVIRSDDALTLFMSNPENYTESETVTLLIDKTSLFEHILSIIPDIYSFRIFPIEDSIPERWPVFFHSERIGQIPERWTLDYKADFLGNQNAQKKPSLCTTRSILKNRRLIGYFQTSVRMEDIFPNIYDTSNKELNQYLFRRNLENGELIQVELESEGKNNAKKGLLPRELDKLQKRINLSEERSGSIVFRPVYKVISWSYIPEINLYLINESNNTSIIQGFSIYIFTIVASLVFMTFALYFVVKYATNRLMAGIYSIMDGMKKVKEGDVSLQIPISGTDEVAETQQIFNSMTKQLSSQIELIKTEQSLIADTEMKAMQNQINAHFLYNVLETIRMQAVLADQDDISESLQVLGKMMRYCLRWRIHRVSLAQEIEYIRSYVYILNIRNDYVISLEIDIPDEYMDVEIPKMTLQPLIENAFVHAIEKTESDASLKVFAKVSEDKSRIVLSVQDFGQGMSEEQVNNILEYLANSGYERDSKGSIGLKNIQQRLTVFYGDDYKMEVKSKLGEGTTISVPVPLKRVSQ